MYIDLTNAGKVKKETEEVQNQNFEMSMQCCIFLY